MLNYTKMLERRANNSVKRIAIVWIVMSFLLIMILATVGLHGEPIVSNNSYRHLLSDDCMENNDTDGSKMMKKGQRNVAEFRTNGTAITSATELKSWLNMMDDGTEKYREAYLNDNITNWEKLYSEYGLELAENRKLDGRGHKITAYTNESVEITSDKGIGCFGLLVDINYGVISNLTLTTGSNIGDYKENNGLTGFKLTKNKQYFVMGALVGINYGIIENCIINIDHSIKLSYNDNIKGITSATNVALGGVTGANIGNLYGGGIINNVVLNLNANGAVAIGVWGKGAAGSGKIGMIAGMASSEIAAYTLTNITITFNGGTVLATPNTDVNGKTIIAFAGVANKGIPTINGWNRGNAPSINSIIINGEMKFLKFDTKQYQTINSLTMQSSLNNSEYMYLSEGYVFSEIFSADATETNNYFLIPYSFRLEPTKDEIYLELSFDNEEYHIKHGNFGEKLDKIIYSVDGVAVYHSQTNQVGLNTKRVVMARQMISTYREDMNIELINVVRIKAYINGEMVGVSENNNLSIANVYNTSILLSGLEENIVIKDIIFANNALTALTKSGEYIIATPAHLFFINGTFSERVTFAVNAKVIDIDIEIMLSYPQEGVSINEGTLSINNAVESIDILAVTNVYGITFTNIIGVKCIIKASLNSAIYAEIFILDSTQKITLEKKKLECNITLIINGEGSASVDKTTVAFGEVVVFIAIENGEWDFMGWSDKDGKYLSTDLRMIRAVNNSADIIVANFAKTYNLVLLNKHNQEYARFQTNISRLVVGEILDLATANLGEAIVDAFNNQPYNTLYGWKVLDISLGVAYIMPVYANSLTKANISVIINGVDKSYYNINDAIVLNKGEYIINNVAVKVENKKTVLALHGLSILGYEDGVLGDSISTDGMKESSANGYYDSAVEVLHLNAVYRNEYQNLSIKVVNSKTNISIAHGSFRGNKANLSNATVMQALLLIEKEVFCNNKDIMIKIYGDGNLIGEFVIIID